jgi:hypothetical protein
MGSKPTAGPLWVHSGPEGEANLPQRAGRRNRPARLWLNEQPWLCFADRDRFGQQFKKGRRSLMRQRSFRVLGSLCFLLLLGLVARGQTYQRPTPPANGGPPTGADLEVYDGASHSLVVQVLNLTPYDIQFVDTPGVTWSVTSADETEMQNRDGAKKSFMFAPVGIPSLLPAAPAQDFVPNYITLPDGHMVWNPAYDPTWEDTTTHPYPMVISWDDQGGFKVNNWVYWTVKNVPYVLCSDLNNASICVSHHQDVQLGLWMYRNKPTYNLLDNGYPLRLEQSAWRRFAMAEEEM